MSRQEQAQNEFDVWKDLRLVLVTGSSLADNCSRRRGTALQDLLDGHASLGSTDTDEIKGLRDGLIDAGFIAVKNLLLDVGIAKTYDGLRPIIQSC